MDSPQPAGDAEQIYLNIVAWVSTHAKKEVIPKSNVVTIPKGISV